MRGRSVSKLAIPPDHWAFQGHFDGFPLLPGVVQLFDIVAAARGARPGWVGPNRLSRLKFLRPIRPGDTCSIELDVDDSARTVRYRLVRGADLCASGRLHFEGADD